MERRAARARLRGVADSAGVAVSLGEIPQQPQPRFPLPLVDLRRVDAHGECDRDVCGARDERHREHQRGDPRVLDPPGRPRPAAPVVVIERRRLDGDVRAAAQGCKNGRPEVRAVEVLARREGVGDDRDERSGAAGPDHVVHGVVEVIRKPSLRLQDPELGRQPDVNARNETRVRDAHRRRRRGGDERGRAHGEEETEVAETRTRFPTRSERGAAAPAGGRLPQGGREERHEGVKLLIPVVRPVRSRVLPLVGTIPAPGLELGRAIGAAGRSERRRGTRRRQRATTRRHRCRGAPRL